MLRPSRPMMRPLSSSDLSSTTDTVVSTAWLDATRCITVARMLRARRSASWRVSSSTWRISRALSWRSSSSSSRSMICFAWPALRPDTLQLAQLVALGALSSSRAWSRLRWRSSSARSRSASSWAWRSSEPSLARRRSSSRVSSARRARSSSSRSSLAPVARRPPVGPARSGRPARRALRWPAARPAGAAPTARRTRRPPPPRAPPTGSPFRCLPRPGAEAPASSVSSGRLWRRETPDVLQKRRARLVGRARSALWTLPNAPSESVEVMVIVRMKRR